jgi:hypothetical protein
MNCFSCIEEHYQATQPVKPAFFWASLHSHACRCLQQVSKRVVVLQEQNILHEVLQYDCTLLVRLG